MRVGTLLNVHAALASTSTCRNHRSSWFQLAKMRLTTSRFARSGFAATNSGKLASPWGLAKHGIIAIGTSPSNKAFWRPSWIADSYA
jgi:hypothetical protein